VRQAGRDSLVLSSKVGYFAGTAAHPYLPSAMRRQLETTLENLQPIIWISTSCTMPISVITTDTWTGL
jgi:aryl-alcohol dehydrogenase-like predicted oxidoreductase